MAGADAVIGAAKQVSPPRGARQRKADTLAKLRAPAADVWVASASTREAALAAGVAETDTAEPYLVPLSLAWVDDRVVLAVASDSRTARNVVATGTARLGLGPTRDVVLIDALLEKAVRLDGAPARLCEGFASQADWDPRQEVGDYVYLVLRPQRIQAWREANELAGRTVMRAGVWVVG